MGLTACVLFLFLPVVFYANSAIG